ncbi:hypothetical protein FHL15_005722 [Xylaria flabelliformis]|uniref:Uncharacterized protein n=1 Tax=Xylaria flabelliformis TaxID=2512241 RepID=A0A553HZR7_9PEZI|nr:hypothetical protein FHL15_005722 [Xylaria flabelliformis]
MACFGNLTAAGISARNENTLALANINFDFSLIKFKAPKEFLQLGKALSPTRRKNAEEGSTHRTARKLGALFEQVASPPEELVKAYGRRASEISQALGARQAGKHLGLFNDHAGADATVLWAAAVSGKTAIAVALLACMLARMWDAPKATSIWVELVLKRKEQIQQICDGSGLSHHALVAASRQDITRRELAEWDASARSWLDIADTVKEEEHRKMETVLLNLSVPVDNSTDIFTSVIRVWNTAMMAMDNLCRGVPQRVYNGAVLIAITSWHLYPDVDVFGGKLKTIMQNDMLVSPGGRLTVGLEDADPESTIGVHWSLSLANLRYYGDPVFATSHMRDASRISFQDLTLVCLGSLFASWESDDFDPLFDQEKGAAFIVALWKNIERMVPGVSGYTHKVQLPQTPNTLEAKARCILSSPNHWLRLLASAAGRLLQSDIEGRATARKLVSLGCRRGRSLLQAEEKGLLPYFGLLDARVLSQFAIEDSSILLFRELAKKLKLHAKCPKAVLYLKDSGGSIETSQFATVSPLQCLGRLHDGEEKLYKSHVRWIPYSEASVSKPFYPGLSNDEVRKFDHDQIQFIEGILHCPQSLWDHQPEDTTPQPPTKELVIEDVISLLDANLLNAVSIVFDIYSSSIYDLPSVQNGDQSEHLTSLTYGKVARKRTEVIINWTLTIKPKLNISRVQRRLEAPSRPQRKRTNETNRDSAMLLAWSLRALSTAADIWPSHTNPTISLKVIERNLWAAPWLPNIDDFHFELGRNLSQTFSCIAMLETGDLIIPSKELKNVFAMSIRNTIYVAASLLADPDTECLPYESRMIIGNVGRPGVSMMIPPADPVLRKPKLESWRVINHEQLTADSKCTDMFDRTSLHLSFTGFEQPVGSTLKQGAQDLEACYLETVVTVFDGSEKIGDLAILDAMDRGLLLKKLTNSPCPHPLRPSQCPRWLVVDSWAELLEIPRGRRKRLGESPQKDVQ